MTPRLMPQLVPVIGIVGAPPCPPQALDAVDALARKLLAARAVAVPLIVRPVAQCRWALLSGDIAYHAARRAREIDPVAGEKVLAFVVEGDDEAALLSQLAYLRT